MKRDEIVGGITVFLFGAATSILSLRMPIGTFRTPGTGLFPFCLGITLMVLSGGFVLQHLFKREKIAEKKEPLLAIGGSARQIILFFGTMILMTSFFNRLGFPLSSFLLMLALLRILGLKKWAANLSLSLITATVCYFLFVQWLQIPLPKGWLGL